MCQDQALVINIGILIPSTLGRKRVIILYLLMKRIVSVLEGWKDSSNSLYYIGISDNAKFYLSDSACGHIPDAITAISSA